MRLLSSTYNLVTIAMLALCLDVLKPPVFGQTWTDGRLDREVLSLFSGYPESDDLKAIVNSHARRDAMTKAHCAFYATWFLHGNVHVPMGTIVGDDGHVNTHTRNSWKKLPAIDIDQLMANIRHLPETMSSVTLANVVIVSFRVDGKWETRLYDRTKPPSELVTVYRLVHAPLDAN